jgi:hypothetical protein
LLSRLRVRLGHLAGLLAIYLAQPTPESLWVGTLLALAGESIRIWASGHIEKTRSLATGGPYAHTRNPLYLGSVIMAMGLASAAASWWTLALALGYLAVFYPAVIRQEAAYLAGKFPEAYREWARGVPLFLPRLTPGGPRGTHFTWRRVWANREWRALLAIPAVLALLYARGRWLP